MKYVDALILCGGRGTRLRSVIADMPKVLALVNGRPFLSYLLDQLVNAGFRDVILCTGYKGEMVKEAFGSHYKGLIIHYSHEPEPLGTGGALRYALPMIEGSYILAMNGDSYIDADIYSFIEWYLKSGYEASILLTKIEDTSRYGRVEIDEDGKIVCFDEKQEESGSGWINAGIYLLKTSLLNLIPSGRFFSLEQQFFPNLVDKSLYAYPCQDELLDIGTPESYARAGNFLSYSEDDNVHTAFYLTGTGTNKDDDAK